MNQQHKLFQPQWDFAALTVKQYITFYIYAFCELQWRNISVSTLYFLFLTSVEQNPSITDHGLNYPMFMSSYCFMVWCLLYQSRKCCTFYAYVFLYLDRSTYTIRWSRKLWMCTLACSISMALLLQYRFQTLGVLPPSVRFIRRVSLVGVFPIAYGLSRVGLLTLEGLWDILPAVKLKEAKRARSPAYCVFDAGPGILLTAFLRKTPASGWTFMLVLAGLFSL